VGLYPAVPLVIPPGEKDFAAVVLQGRKQNEKIRIQTEQTERKQDEHLLASMTPEEAAEYKADLGKAKREQKKSMERIMGLA